LKTLLITLFLLLPIAVSAQNRSSKHTCRILFFDAPADAPNTLYLFDGEGTQQVQLPRMNFSPVYELPAGQLNLRLLAAAPDDPRAIPRGAPSARVPETMADFYLILTSDPDNPVAPVKMQVIDAGYDKVKQGQMMWFNLTSNMIGGNVGDQQLVVQPQSSTVLDAPIPNAGEYPIRLFFQMPDDERTHPLTSTSWGHNPRTRNIIFINTVPNSSTPRVRGFTDFRTR